MCGRVISGRRDGPGWMILAPHTRIKSPVRAEPCLTMGARRRVRILPGPPA